MSAPGGGAAAPVLVGVAGGSASGKSTLVARLVASLGPDRTLVIHHDAYYRDRAHLPPADRSGINYDHPDALETELMVAHLEAIRAGRAVEVPVYDFTTHERRRETVRVEPRPVVVVDGILVLSDTRIRRLLQVAVFVDTPADIRLARRLQRDTAERGRTPESVVRQYVDTVRPMHDAHVEPGRRHAHVVVTGAGTDVAGLERILRHIAAAARTA